MFDFIQNRGDLTLHPIADVESFGQAVTGKRRANPWLDVRRTSSASVERETNFKLSDCFNFIAISPLELIDMKFSNAVLLIWPFSVNITTSFSFVCAVIGRTAAILLALLTLMSWVIAVPEAVLDADGIE